MAHFKSIKAQINLFLAVLALFVLYQEPRFAIVTGFGMAILFSVLIETSFLYFKTKKLQITDSSLTSGLIIGFVFASESPWWLFLVVSILSLGLKRLIRVHGKNLLNPAAAGIFLAVFLFKGYTEWKGAYSWYFLVPTGLYLVYKIRKWELAAGYFIMALLLFIPQTLKEHVPITDVFGYFNYFFIFIMLIEPKTSPAKRWPKVFFGAGTALLIFILTNQGFRYEPELFALLVFNILTPWLDKIPNFKFSKSNPAS